MKTIREWLKFLKPCEHEPAWIQRFDSPNYPGKRQRDYILGCSKCCHSVSCEKYPDTSTYPHRDDLMEKIL